MPYGTLDLRIAKSSTRYYYLQEDTTFSYRESAPGVKTYTYRDLTSWNSAPYKQGNLREKNGASDLFVMNYRILFPQNYNPDYDPGYPFILMLHGAGESGNCWGDNCHWDSPSWNPNTNNPPAPTDVNHDLLNNDRNLFHGGSQHLTAVNLAGSRLPNDPSMPEKAFPGIVVFPQALNGWYCSFADEQIQHRSEQGLYPWALQWRWWCISGDQAGTLAFCYSAAHVWHSRWRYCCRWNDT
jgi:hypothetical protein